MNEELIGFLSVGWVVAVFSTLLLLIKIEGMKGDALHQRRLIFMDMQCRSKLNELLLKGQAIMYDAVHEKERAKLLERIKALEEELVDCAENPNWTHPRSEEE